MPIPKKVNKDFFKKWSSRMAYVLGFFAADGYITVNRRGGQFWCIDITDEKLIKQIKGEIGAEHKISVRKRHKDKYTSYRLQIGSIEMCEDLRRLGFSENKTKSLAVPHVPQKYFADFVRGYFDGDGNIWMGRIARKWTKVSFKLMTMFTSCSPLFLTSLHQRLITCGIVGGYIYTSKKNYSRLQFSVNDSLKLYNFMYNTSEDEKNGLLLGRKKAIFEKYRQYKGQKTNAAVV